MPPPTPSALCVCPIGTKKQKENLITFKFMTVTAFSQGNLPRQPPYCGGHGVGFLQRSFSWVSCCSLYFILSVGVANFEGLSVLHCALPFSFWDCPPPPPPTSPLELGTSQIAAHLQPSLSPDSSLARKRNESKVFQQKSKKMEKEGWDVLRRGTNLGAWKEYETGRALGFSVSLAHAAAHRRGLPLSIC